MSTRLEYLRMAKFMCHPLPETLDKVVLQRISDGLHPPEGVMEGMEGINNFPGAPAGTDSPVLRTLTIAEVKRLGGRRAWVDSPGWGVKG